MTRLRLGIVTVVGSVVAAWAWTVCRPEPCAVEDCPEQYLAGSDSEIIHALRVLEERPDEYVADRGAVRAIAFDHPTFEIRRQAWVLAYVRHDEAMIAEGIERLGFEPLSGPECRTLMADVASLDDPRTEPCHLSAYYGVACHDGWGDPERCLAWGLPFGQ